MAEDNTWVFDSLVCFLHGPIWNAPLQTFVEEKSLIFDPNEKSDGRNPEYVKVHEEYKNLVGECHGFTCATVVWGHSPHGVFMVDYMLGSFMEEMQITPEQFEVACLEGRESTAAGSAFSFHQGLFQQIWAANDIRIFVRMMTTRNVELQLQALDLIERRQNSSQKEDDTSETRDVSDVTQEELEKMTTDDGADEEIFQSVEKQWNEKSEDDKTENEDEINDKFQRLNLFFEKDNVSKADVQSRQEYLRAQRDKILKIKKKARAYQLNESVKKNGRPTSAQAAQNILESGTTNPSDSPYDASIQLRKTLAKRLRTEVVGNE